MKLIALLIAAIGAVLAIVWLSARDLPAIEEREVSNVHDGTKWVYVAPPEWVTTTSPRWDN